uniref:Uncharacterized protein n=1 Tax=Chromera velia CCMP2878 TaxID=1169474 RepID=A0A0G4FZX9_9ALVE|eukprot:Cvel_19457.t1-p1 / transcript=Cvel_19457.t1 / gene=Cvel_19457 / organism=Chromera_velia_CCMP2878 / gene_product=hypothetical protein / transcript_product=hypothetical protein / location=Cvel_scaffold1679:8275-8742(-) / protein_length=156 / sequence_SO=supercontig / SO=protein_coding / is_pseudo=false
MLLCLEKALQGCFQRLSGTKCALLIGRQGMCRDGSQGGRLGVLGVTVFSRRRLFLLCATARVDRWGCDSIRLRSISIGGWGKKEPIAFPVSSSSPTVQMMRRRTSLVLMMMMMGPILIWSSLSDALQCKDGGCLCSWSPLTKMETFLGVELSQQRP